MDTRKWPRDARGKIITTAAEEPSLHDLLEESRQQLGDATTEPGPDPPTPDPRIQTVASIPPRTLAGAVLGSLVILAILLALVGRALGSSPAAAPTPPSTPPSTSTPIAQLDRAIVAYAAPGGAVLGAVEGGRPYDMVARAGDTWVQLQIDSGLVWVSARDLDRPIGALRDLATAAPVLTHTSVPALLPTPPQSTAPAACTQYTAPWVIMREIADTHALPIGRITAWSCVSQVDAEANAAAEEQRLRAIVRQTQEAAP